MPSSLKFSLAVPVTFPRHAFDDDALVARLQKLKEYIYDINVTCRVEPFRVDALGVIVDPMHSQMHIRDALRVQSRSGVTVSGLFNNIYVPPTKENLELFVKGLAPLYGAGLRSITIPHTLWMKFGLLQREFPELRIKSTVLRRVRSGQDFWNLAEAGFDYVMIDRLVMRDRHTLELIRAAQLAFHERDGKKVMLAALAGESRCRGDCPFWEEHYQHTMTHPDADTLSGCDTRFNVPPNYSCNRFGNVFSAPILPPFREDFAEVAALIDVVKFNGRPEDHTQVWLDLIDEVVHGAGPVIGSIAQQYPGRLEGYQKWSCAGLVDAWRHATRTCGFQCWRCRLCFDLLHAVSEELTQAKRKGEAVRRLLAQHTTEVTRGDASRPTTTQSAAGGVPRSGDPTGAPVPGPRRRKVPRSR
ncbi:MAG: hypothetical protein HY906_13870 [Deltaproteobacteria bacterium]|nr:hypothetical protein [Deltaproteobacteria bacterium]